MTINAAASILPPDEQSRLDAVRRCDGLDSAARGAFARFARIAAAVFDLPVATISIVDTDQVWFLATHGLEVATIDRDVALCALAILQDAPFVVTDTVTDPRCCTSAAIEQFGVRCYVGAPIRTPDGYNLGTVNVISTRPQAISAEQVATLELIASAVGVELENRLIARSRATAHDVELLGLRGEVSSLQTALESRIAIEQAKGILAERYGEPVDVAFARLRGRARSTQQKLHQVAADVVSGALQL